MKLLNDMSGLNTGDRIAWRFKIESGWVWVAMGNVITVYEKMYYPNKTNTYNNEVARKYIRCRWKITHYTTATNLHYLRLLSLATPDIKDLINFGDKEVDSRAHYNKEYWEVWLLEGEKDFVYMLKEFIANTF